MSGLTELLASFVGHESSLVFSVLLAFHVVAGLTSVVAGAVAMRSPKRRGRHPRFGQIYYCALAVVFVTSTNMSLLRWEDDAYLFVLGTLSFGAATVGVVARRVRWPGWTTAHIIGMSLSYIVLLTAFYVDNGPRLPLWQLLPTIAFWTLPALLGLPLLALALARYGGQTR